jgi:UDP-glucose 4-epimerase
VVGNFTDYLGSYSLNDDEKEVTSECRMKNILVTGAAGYLGGLLVEDLAQNKDKLGIDHIIATDVRELKSPIPHVTLEKLDVRDDGAKDLFEKYQIDCVVHLASIVTPGKDSRREFEYSVDVLGTKNILKACVETNVKRVIISSSGAAYGYYPENIHPLREDAPIRGNYEFAYSHHKKLVEEMLAQYRRDYPKLEQTIFRITTILGENVNNQITDLFKKPFQIGLLNNEVGFSFIWDQDAVACFKEAIFSEKTGIYNLSGDGYMTIAERSQMLKKPRLMLPATLVAAALWLLKKLGLTQYGPEQILFLKYRPILDNKKLKEDFGFKPKMTSKDVFSFYVKNVLKIS